MKKAIIIHGWGGSPEEGIHTWMKQELEAQGFEVNVPIMPNTDEPTINEWVPFLKNLAPNPDENTFFIGHSIGCQTILRYLEGLPENTKVGGIVMIAPWVKLLDTAYEDPEEEQKIAQPWIETPINWEKIKTHTTNVVSIFSDNDPCVPLGDKETFAEKLSAKIIVEHEKGHFTEEDNITQVPAALNALKEMAQ